MTKLSTGRVWPKDTPLHLKLTYTRLKAYHGRMDVSREDFITLYRAWRNIKRADPKALQFWNGKGWSSKPLHRPGPKPDKVRVLGKTFTCAEAAVLLNISLSGAHGFKRRGLLASKLYAKIKRSAK